MIHARDPPNRKKYKIFQGKNPRQMDLLTRDNRSPMTTKQIIEQRLYSDDALFRDFYFDTGDAIVYGKPGKFKIMRESEFLKTLSSRTRLVEGGVKIPFEFYPKLFTQEYDENSSLEEVWTALIGELYHPYVEMLGYRPSFIFSESDSYMLRPWTLGNLEVYSMLDGGTRMDELYGRWLGLANEMKGASTS